MTSQTFPCPYCQQTIGVAPEHAGLPVSCPHCRQVVMAPASIEQKAAELTTAHKRAVERTDSIFGDEEDEDGDDEALFGPKKKPNVELVKHADLTQPTQRVPGLAPPPKPLEPIIEEEENPFEVETEPAPVKSKPKKPRNDTPAAAEPTTPNWKLWIIIGLSVYAFFITVIAIWGWTRSPGQATSATIMAPKGKSN